MRLVPKKVLFFYLFINYNVQTTSLMPAHTFSSGAAIVCGIPGTYFVGGRFKTCVTDLWMLSVDSKWFHFTADFHFCSKKKSQGARSGE